MAKFVKRIAAPSKTDRHYYSNENIFFACGYGMPNCTAYAWGRLYELTNVRYTNLCGNAEEWWAAAPKAGLKTGQTPKLGAIICWRSGSATNRADGAGHVAVVEEIMPNGDIVTSNSAWKGTEFDTKTITKASGYQYSSSVPLLGFIYCGIEFETASSTSSATDAEYLIHTVVKGDTLWNLAVKYLGKGSKYTEIKKLNGLKSNTLSVGMKLKIPGKGVGYQCVHTVVKGDTLWQLASKYLGRGTRYGEIKKINGLKSDTLTVGMKLKIPNK